MGYHYGGSKRSNSTFDMLFPMLRLYLCRSENYVMCIFLYCLLCCVRYNTPQYCCAALPMILIGALFIAYCSDILRRGILYVLQEKSRGSIEPQCYNLCCASLGGRVDANRILQIVDLDTIGYGKTTSPLPLPRLHPLPLLGSFDPQSRVGTAHIADAQFF